MAAGPTTSLVRYEAAELVTGKAKSSKVAIPKLDRRVALPPKEELLNAILPPREWTADGHLWVQKVSSTPATRIDVINLQEQLDLRLQQRLARETGICPIREELYAQCFGACPPSCWMLRRCVLPRHPPPSPTYPHPKTIPPLQMS